MFLIIIKVGSGVTQTKQNSSIFSFKLGEYKFKVCFRYYFFRSLLFNSYAINKYILYKRFLCKIWWEEYKYKLRQSIL